MGLTCVAVLASLIPYADSLTIYVSPTGDDSAVGTERAPVRTVSQALVLLRTNRKSSNDAETIRLAVGDYPVAEPIQIGTQDANLTIQGAPGTRLFAGKILADWKPVTDAVVLNRLPSASKGHVLVADVSADPVLGSEKPGDPIADLDLVFDHTPLQLARWPQTGFLMTGAVSEPQTFQTAEDAPFQWKSGADVWAMGYWKYDYVQELNRVDLSSYKSVQLQGKLNAGLAPDRRFIFLNVLEGLDSPGEFYFDRGAHQIYFYPPTQAANGVTGHEVFVESSRASIFAIKNCSKLTVENLAIEGGRGSVGSVDGGSDIVFQRCQIRDFGGSGLAFHGCVSSGVSRCEISGLGAYGVSLDAGDRKTLAPGANFADDNRIYNFGRWHRSYQPAILIQGVGNRATHNEIHDAPHAAILLGGNDHDIEYNDIYHVCTEAGDAGAIYEGRDPSFRGLMVRFNRFRDISPTVARTHDFLDVSSVYLDDRLCGATIFGNIFEGPGIGVLLGGGRDDKIQNNIFLNKTIGVRVDQRGKTWEAGKPLETYIAQTKEALSWSPLFAKKYPEMSSILGDDAGAISNDDVSKNVCVVGTGTFLGLEDNLTANQLGNADNVLLTTGTLQDAIDHAPNGFVSILMKAIGPRA